MSWGATKLFLYRKVPPPAPTRRRFAETRCRVAASSGHPTQLELSSARGQADDFPRWAELHRPQLVGIALPRPLWRQLHRAVRTQELSAGSWVQVQRSL
jgi:hypothetical protein